MRDGRRILAGLSLAIMAFLAMGGAAQASCSLPEREAREAALAASDIGPIDTYLECHQYSDFAVSVREHRRQVVTQEAFAQAATIDDYRAFLLRFPDSPLVDQALLRIDELANAVTYIPYQSSILLGTPIGNASVANADACAAACTAQGTCQGYSFATGGQCSLFDGLTGRMPRGNVVSGSRTELSLGSADPATPAAGGDANFFVRQGLFVSGGTISTLPSSSAGACQASCVANRQCVAFAYELVSGQCALRSSLSGSQSNPAYVSGMRSSGPAGAAPPVAPAFDIFANVDLENPRGSAFDYSIVLRKSAAQCEQLCAADNKCKAFTHNGQVNACILKSGYSRAVSFMGATSGQKR